MPFTGFAYRCFFGEWIALLYLFVLECLSVIR